VQEEEGVVHVDYDGRRVEYETGELDEVSLAFATTIHKSHPAVVTPLAVQRLGSTKRLTNLRRRLQP
jgi:exodeoxyribonuclease V alpha subunit